MAAVPLWRREPSPTVALITATGTITNGRGGKAPMRREMASGPLCQLIAAAREDPTVKALVLRIDSRGTCCVCWCVLGCVCVCWCVPVRVDMCWCTLECVMVLVVHVSVCGDVCRLSVGVLLVGVSVCQCVINVLAPVGRVFG